MAIDHPDGTLPIAFSKSDIKVPVDIQAQYITLDVDIVAQTVGNITVDIAAQTVGNIEVDIKAATAKVAVTIAAADITGNIPIDIAAQTVGNIDIDIAAQTVGNIDINLAASAITLDINIVSQAANVDVNIAASAVTITVSVSGTANIDITAQSVGVYLKPDWEEKEGTDKFFYADEAAAENGRALVTWTVTAGKTLKITNMTVCMIGADGYRDLPQNFQAYIYDGTTGDWLEEIGGNGGGSWHFDIPIPIPEEHDFYLYCYNRSDHSAVVYVTARGYLV